MEEVPSITAGSRRNEDIALDLMKFVNSRPPEPLFEPPKVIVNR